MRTASLLIIVIVCRAAGGQTMAVREYLEGLEGLRAELEGGTLSRVRRLAGGLLNRRVSCGEGRVPTDRTVLPALARTRDIRQARGLSTRLEVLIEALRRETVVPGAPTAPDAALLERLREEERLAEIEEGGKVGLPQPKETRFTRWLAGKLRAFADWAVEQWKKFLEWLADFLPKRRPASLTRLPMTKLMVAVLLVVVAVALVFVAYYLLRGGRGGRGPEGAASSGPVRSSRDEDVLSRSATEWEEHAAELAAAGRAREAIRAWYHAVLVTLYRAGILHYRKGRTNWEYAYSLSPELAWRHEFIEMTHRFEREWYGRERSSPDEVRACAETAGGILSAVREGAR